MKQDLGVGVGEGSPQISWIFLRALGFSVTARVGTEFKKERVGTVFKKKNSSGNLLQIYISLAQRDAWCIIGSNTSVLNEWVSFKNSKETCCYCYGCCCQTLRQCSGFALYVGSMKMLEGPAVLGPEDGLRGP